jgi:hypothetical protein
MTNAAHPETLVSLEEAAELMDKTYQARRSG